MAFESVNPYSLKVAIKACEDKIHLNKIKDIESELKNTNKWNTSARKSLFQALEKLDSYQINLKEKLKYYEKIADYIEQYKSLDNQEITYKQEKSTLSSKNDDNSKEIDDLNNKLNDINSKKSTLLAKINQLV